MPFLSLKVGSENKWLKALRNPDICKMRNISEKSIEFCIIIKIIKFSATQSVRSEFVNALFKKGASSRTGQKPNTP